MMRAMKQHIRSGVDRACRVRIHVGGQLDADWSAWFEGLSVIPLANGETRLSGTVPDQASLHGLLARIRDLGLPLLSLDVTAIAPLPGGRRPTRRTER